MTYGHIQTIAGSIKKREAIAALEHWTRKNFAGSELPSTVQEVLDAYDKGRVTKVFWRYERTLCVKLPDGVWYEGEKTI